MEESFFRPCALTIERSFYTQSRHDEHIVSYAYIVLRLVSSAEDLLHQSCITKPFYYLLRLFVVLAVEKHLTILHFQIQQFVLLCFLHNSLPDLLRQRGCMALRFQKTLANHILLLLIISFLIPYIFRISWNKHYCSPRFIDYGSVARFDKQ